MNIAASSSSKIGSAQLDYSSKPLLSKLGLLRFKGHPYSFDDFRPMAAMLRQNIPQYSVWKTGRQVGKSMTISVFGLLLAMMLEDFHIMYAVPLFDQAKTFSRDRIEAILRDSPVLQQALKGAYTTNTWDRKILANNSSIRIAYVLKNVMRIRGESADMLNSDEFQEQDESIQPVVESCLKASHYGFHQYTGTPMTTTNLLEEVWSDSSQAEWEIPCQNPSCGHWNRPTLEEGLLDMIGEDGTKCCKCDRPIDPGHPEAQWVHAHPDRAENFPGFHVPQIIMPLHYALPHKWDELLYNKKKWGKAQFLNECLGEPCDVGLKRLSPADIKKAGVLKPRTYADAVNQRGNYDMVVLGADWGGKGYAEQRSRTAYAVIGKRKGEFAFDLLWHRIFDISMSTGTELEDIGQAFRDFKCDCMGYDKNTDPSYEYLLEHDAQIPMDKAHGIIYRVHPAKDLMDFHPPDENHPTGYYSVDKTRSLILLFEAFKRGKFFVPEWRAFKESAKDLLAFEDTWSTRQSDVLLIKRVAGQSDDLAQAINYSMCMLLYRYDAFGDILGSSDMRLRSILGAAEGPA